MKTKIAFALSAFILSAFTTLTYATDASFSISASLYQSIALTNVNGITFPEHEVVTSDTNITVAPADTGAAKFSATGAPDRAVTGSVTTDSVSLQCSTPSTCNRETMTINNFTYGGDMNNSGNATFSNDGKLNNLLIGATQQINASNNAGTYSGNATFRLVYS